MKNKQLIISGNRGFIGYNFSKLLEEKNYNFYGIDAEIYGSNNFELPKNCIKQYKYNLQKGVSKYAKYFYSLVNY